MRWNDDVEPFRYGGNNSRAGKPVIRYGPRPNAEREYQKQNAEHTYYKRLLFIEDNIHTFNNANSDTEKQIALKNVLSQLHLHLPKIGEIYELSDFWEKFHRTKFKTPARERIIRVAENQLAIKKLFSSDPVEYITERVIPLSRITLELKGENKEDWKKSMFEIHATIKDDDRPSWRKSFLGY